MANNETKLVIAAGIATFCVISFPVLFGSFMGNQITYGIIQSGISILSTLILFIALIRKIGDIEFLTKITGFFSDHFSRNGGE